MDINERLKEAVSASGLSLQDFTNKIGANYRTMQHYLSGSRKVSAELLAAMAEHLDISPTWLLTGRGARLITENVGANAHENQALALQPNDRVEEFVAIPRFDAQASAGFGSLVEVDVGSGCYGYSRASIQRRGLSEDHLSVIRVAGDSMEPEFSDGDLVLIATDQKEPRNGFMFAVHYDGQLFVKRVQRLPGNRLQLISTNARYPPIIVDLEAPEDVRLEGRVVASMREW